jgi:hypothetical protein
MWRYSALTLQFEVSIRSTPPPAVKPAAMYFDEAAFLDPRSGTAMVSS